MGCPKCRRGQGEKEKTRKGRLRLTGQRKGQLTILRCESGCGSLPILHLMLPKMAAGHSMVIWYKFSILCREWLFFYLAICNSKYIIIGNPHPQDVAFKGFPELTAIALSHVNLGLLSAYSYLPKLKQGRTKKLGKTCTRWYYIKEL